MGILRYLERDAGWAVIGCAVVCSRRICRGKARRIGYPGLEAEGLRSVDVGEVGGVGVGLAGEGLIGRTLILGAV